MENLTPREIQTRIRSGESLESVIEASGMAPARVEAFAAPVIDERAHIASLALASPVRRAGESASIRALRQVVAERLASRGLDINQVTWDAWRRSDGRWLAEGRYRSGDNLRLALFLFDHRGRFSVADNDEARWLIGDPSPSHGPQPTRRRHGDDEPTVDVEPPPALTPPAELTPSWLDVPASLLDFGDTDPDDSSSRATLDSLYDMISVIEEDSVRIYRGLREPLDIAIQAEPDDLSPELPAAPVTELAPKTRRRRPAAPAVVVVPDPDPLVEVAEAPVPEPPVPPAEPPVTEPAPTTSRRRKRDRASVPSWDEIMFGGPPA